jgi:hypothetical protein
MGSTGRRWRFAAYDAKEAAIGPPRYRLRPPPSDDPEPVLPQMGSSLPHHFLSWRFGRCSRCSGSRRRSFGSVVTRVCKQPCANTISSESPSSSRRRPTRHSRVHARRRMQARPRFRITSTHDNAGRVSWFVNAEDVERVRLERSWRPIRSTRHCCLRTLPRYANRIYALVAQLNRATTTNQRNQ